MIIANAEYTIIVIVVEPTIISSLVPSSSSLISVTSVSVSFASTIMLARDEQDPGWFCSSKPLPFKLDPHTEDVGMRG